MKGSRCPYCKSDRTVVRWRTENGDGTTTHYQLCEKCGHMWKEDRK